MKYVFRPQITLIAEACNNDLPKARRILQRIAKRPASVRATFFRVSPPKVVITALTVAFALLVITPRDVYLQDKNEFEVNSLIRDVTRRFKLSAHEVKSIRPLIHRENRNVVALYARFSGDRPEFSERLWNVMLASNVEFEMRIERDLTDRQKAALRAAHREIQRRIVDYLAEEHLGFISEYLEFDEWTFEDVRKVFETARVKKLRLVCSRVNVSVLQKQMEELDAEIKNLLRKLLTEGQWRAYLELTEPLALSA